MTHVLSFCWYAQSFSTCPPQVWIPSCLYTTLRFLSHMSVRISWSRHCIFLYLRDLHTFVCKFFLKANRVSHLQIYPHTTKPNSIPTKSFFNFFSIRIPFWDPWDLKDQNPYKGQLEVKTSSHDVNFHCGFLKLFFGGVVMY
jgi:hypothetical protein